MTTSWETAAHKAMREGSVRPKNFMGGSDTDYRVVLGKSRTFLTEHVPSGKKVPAVEAGQVLRGASQVLNTILGGVAAVASVYGAYEARKGRKETQEVRAEMGQMRDDLHMEFKALGTALQRSETLITEVVDAVREEGELTRAEVRMTRQLDREREWNNLSHDWGAFLESSTARVALAEALRTTARNFINGLKAEVSTGSTLRAAEAAPYLFTAFVALAMAYDALGEPVQAQRQFQRLADDLRDLGSEMARGATLLGVEEHEEAFDIVWGLRRRAAYLAATTNGVAQLIALSGASVDRTTAELPILTRTSDLLLPLGSGGLGIDDPWPVRTALDLELIKRLGGEVSGTAASVPTTRQALASLGHPRPNELMGEVDGDLLESVLLDPDAGLGELRRDFTIDTPAPRSYEGNRESVVLDWPQVTEGELDHAWEETESGATEDGIQRLALLMRFLDGILGQEGSPLYPEITLEPLLALSEFSLRLHRERAGDEHTLDRARKWISTLACNAQSLEREYYSFEAHLLELRLDAWTNPDADPAGRLRALQECELVGEDLVAVMTTLRDIATATGDVDAALDVAKALLPPRADLDHEDSWYRARIEFARLMAQGGDRKKARGIAARVRHALETHGDAPWLGEALQEASELAEELRARDPGD